MIAIVTVGTIIAGIVMQRREKRRIADEQLAFANIDHFSVPTAVYVH